MTKRYIVSQYKGYWSLSRIEWHSLVNNMVYYNEEGYDLSNYKQLKSKPAYIQGTGRESFSSHTSIELRQPLDWTLADWEAEYNDLLQDTAKEFSQHYIHRYNR